MAFMTPERWQQIKRLFHSALEREPGQRAAFIARACAGDEVLRKEVESLVASHAQADSFIETPASDVAAEMFAGGQTRLEAGQKIGHYTIMALLGAGGMGEVYLAKDQKLDRQVAVKILNERFNRHESSLQRFVREAKAASALNHPNILVIHEIGEADDAHYIVSEYVTGQTLRELVSEAPMKLADVLDIGVQIANALAAAHQACLVHRDIKPENIIISPAGYVKILDFGLAKLVEQKNKSLIRSDGDNTEQNQTARGVILGTVNYMSPEQAKGERVDERTDIFSLGVVLYEMIAGKAPFAGNSKSETFANLINQEPKPLSLFAAGVSAELQRIVSRLLCKNRDERYQTMKDVLTDLKDLLEQLRSQGKLETFPAPERENRTGALAVSTGEAKGFTSPELTEQTAKLTLAPTRQVIEHRPRYRVYIAMGLILAGALATIAQGLYRYLGGNKAPLVFQALHVRRLTSTGRVKTTVISPDGNFTIYAQEENSGQQSLWMQHIGSESNVQIVLPSDIEYRALNITPDGNSIYYLDEKQSIYQIPVLGGTAKKIAEGLLHNSAIGFSPDGKQFTFVRRFENNASALFTVNVDGTNEQKVISIEQPMRLQVDPAWSPDGKIIACPILIDGFFKILSVQLADRKTALISPNGWSVIRKLTWLPDSNSLIFIGTVKANVHQLFQISYPGGEARQITSDLNNYDDFSLSFDGRSLAAVKVEQTAHLWTTPSNDLTRARQITSGFETFDGIYSLDWMSDSKILYTSSPNDDISIWTIEADGDNPKQLVKGGHYPRVSPDHRLIVYRKRIGSEQALLRMDVSDGSEKQLSKGIVHYPTFSPDGKWLVFSKFNDRMSLWKVPVAGGEATQILVADAICSAVSPDGKTIAFVLRRGGNSNRIALVSFDGGEIIKTFDAVLASNPFSNNQNLQWTRDGRAIYYIAFNHGVSNIWQQPIDGSPPVQVTGFETGRIFNFSYSPDGKQLALSRGTFDRDVVLIENSR
jgi:eukaryotic-like serine/threonine-protein kinase